MSNRFNRLQGTSALLYFGPLLAGLGGFGWAVVPAFAVIFLMWQVVVRPDLLPRTLAFMKSPAFLIGLAQRSVTLVFFVAVCFGIGRGIGGVVGFLPPFPVFLPLALSFAAVPLARLFWRPDDLDAAPPLTSVDAVVALVEPLTDLPPETTDTQIAAHLAVIATHADPEAIRAALAARMTQGDAGPVLRRAAGLARTLRPLEPSVAQRPVAARPNAGAVGGAVGDAALASG
jgi:hypothetical protein